LKPKQIEPFAKRHLFNNSSVKKQNREQTQTNAPLGPRHWQCTEQFGQLRLASDFTCSMVAHNKTSLFDVLVQDCFQCFVLLMNLHFPLVLLEKHFFSFGAVTNV
jgi:hypothetical protein